MKGFSFFDKEENSLKDWALSYVKATKGEIGSQMEGDRDYPFLVINLSLIHISEPTRR